MINDEKKERTEEYFYKDITNFSTSTKSVKYRDKTGTEKTRDTTSFTIVVPGDKIEVAMRPTSEIEQSIQAMKQKLREKKG